MERFADLILQKEQKDSFVTILLLDKIINQVQCLKVNEYDDILADDLSRMCSVGVLEFDEAGRKFIPTEKGRKTLQDFLNKYTEFLKVIDLYCAVDRTCGEFAYSTDMFHMDEDEFNAHLSNPRFDDFRLAVCKFKKLNIAECAFMIWHDVNGFDLESTGWEFDLVSGIVWDEMMIVVKESIDYEHIQFEDDNGDLVEAESVLEGMIGAGSELMKELFAEEKRIEEENQEEEEDDEEEIIEEVEIVEYVEPVYEADPCFYDPYYYDPYYDPYYASAVLATALFLY